MTTKRLEMMKRFGDDDEKTDDDDVTDIFRLAKTASNVKDEVSTFVSFDAGFAAHKKARGPRNSARGPTRWILMMMMMVIMLYDDGRRTMGD